MESLDTDHLFFTSDTHFHHANIIRFCDRPFRDVEEMDEILIRNWNEVVGPEDTIFHLGVSAWVAPPNGLRCWIA